MTGHQDAHNHRYSEMMVREICLLRIFNDDHIVSMIEAFRYNGLVHIVFPLMRCNLYRYLELNGGALTIDVTKKFLISEKLPKVLRGLNYIHNQNVVHRDIKPENILLSANGVIKICDFGVSRMYCADQTLDLSTEMGTVWYQAPEMLMESTKYDATVDIWSVGILFTELVNKMPLVTEDTIISQLYGITKILGNNNCDLAVVDKYLRKHGFSLNLEANFKPLSQSYTVSKTAMALRKVYDWWPTHLMEIVTYCLQFNPNNRKNAVQLLDMKFFTAGTFLLRFNKELNIKLKNDNARYQQTK
ncbi:probable cell division protein kinase ECU08_0230 [Melanaphis sacchari]|uniref:probable cell division protein kinase ECU08_0230 n=1 Tax=Melanaphis sacchari TaxID=742174 RepID=UPI000DC15552|nr:probable cell division protein kinase ECU08_0230 [Melanaphis sacchari]